MKTTTTTEEIKLTNAQITEACVLFALELLCTEHTSARITGAVEISPDCSWEAEGKNEYRARVTFTTLVKA